MYLILGNGFFFVKIPINLEKLYGLDYHASLMVS